MKLQTFVVLCFLSSSFVFADTAPTKATDKKEVVADKKEVVADKKEVVADKKEVIEGIWKTIDDKTKKPKSHLKVWIEKGVAYGKIIKLINPSVPNPLCDKCKGAKHNKPIIGMQNLWGLKKKGKDWDGGHILDPKNGKVYKAKIWPSKDGKVLNVRGYVWIFHRTQKWHRVK